MSFVKKCIVWDLDNTVWNGICLEGRVAVRPEIRKVIAALDQRGILHAIASRNEKEAAWQVLCEQDLAHYFVAPQINWLPKSTNILTISDQLNISLDAIAFVDDEPFEREQVAFMLPDVLTIDAEQAQHLTRLPAFSPGYTTRESKSRRDFYQADEKRKAAEQQFSSREAFLIACRMKLTVRPMQKTDINRVSELMSRTHQLNTTGLILEKEKLHRMLSNPQSDQMIMVAELEDKYGRNGIIGTALIQRDPHCYRIRFFALSCRILGRGIERAFLADLMQKAAADGLKQTEAMYKNTGRNSMMRAFYQMCGFKHKDDLADQTMMFSLSNSHIPGVPKWVEVL